MSHKSCFFVGPRIQELAPLLASHGWTSTGFASGAEAMDAVIAHPPDVVAFEVDLDDGLARVFVRDVREQARSQIVLLEDPAKAHRIISELTQGIEHYLPTPADEERLLTLFSFLAGQTQPSSTSAFDDEALKESLADLQRRNLELQLNFDDARARQEATEKELSKSLDAKVLLDKEIAKQRATIESLEIEVEESTREIKMSSLVPTDEGKAFIAGVSSPEFKEAVEKLWPAS